MLTKDHVISVSPQTYLDGLVQLEHHLHLTMSSQSWEDPPYDFSFQKPNFGSVSITDFCGIEILHLVVERMSEKSGNGSHKWRKIEHEKPLKLTWQWEIHFFYPPGN